MNIGVIFAGGSGKRMHTNGLPKQFLKLNDKPIIIYTLEHFEACADIDAVTVACIADYIDVLKDYLERFRIRKVKRIVPGGATGQESIFHGLCAAREIVREAGGDEARTIVLIHDGVRPLITEELLSANIRKTQEAGNAVTVAPAHETIFRYDADTKAVSQILDRSTCYVAKAPQTFFLRDILNAHEKARENGEDYIDSASLMQAYGHTLHTVESTPDNIKVTTPSDYYMLRAILQESEQAGIFGL